MKSSESVQNELIDCLFVHICGKPSDSICDFFFLVAFKICIRENYSKHVYLVKNSIIVKSYSLVTHKQHIFFFGLFNSFFFFGPFNLSTNQLMTHNNAVAKLQEDSDVLPLKGKTLDALGKKCEKYLTLGGFRGGSKVPCFISSIVCLLCTSCCLIPGVRLIEHSGASPLRSPAESERGELRLASRPLFLGPQ